MLKIIADSTCNLPPDLLARHQIPIAPIAIQFGEQSYDEFLTIDRDLFYRKIEETGTIPTTSQPSPAWFAELYRQAARDQAPVLVLTVTGQAQRHLPVGGARPLHGAGGRRRGVRFGQHLPRHGLDGPRAARLSQAGRSRSAILQRLTTIRKHSHLYLTPATLKYLQMSGRVGKLQGALASLLNVKPIIILKDGLLEATRTSARGARPSSVSCPWPKSAVGSTPIHMGVIHARAPEEAQELLTKVTTRLNCEEVMLEDLVPSLAVHGGPGVLGLAFYAD